MSPLPKFAGVMAMTVAMVSTSAAFADNEEAPKPQASAKTESAKTESTKTPPKAEVAKKPEPAKAEKAEAPKAEAPKAETAAPEPASAPEPAPLQVRSQKPLTLAPQNESTPWGYKLFAFVVVAGGIAFWVKKRRKIDAGKQKPARLDIVARSSVGVRSELIVVEVEGTRLLVGMTPSAISTLAILDSGDPMMARDEAPAHVEREPAIEPAAFVAANVTDRVRTLLGGKTSPARPSPESTQRMTKRTPVTRIATSRMPVAAQAKGLLLALEEDRAIDR